MAKQKELGGMNGKGVEKVSIPEIDECLEKYIAARDKRQEHLRKEVVLKTELIQLLNDNKEKLGCPDGQIFYHHGEEVVRLEPGKLKLKVESAAEQDED